MARRREALVTQHLENVSREVLERYQQLAQDFIRGRHGVYALYRRGKLYYVGLATNLRGRLKSHLRDRHGESWDRFSVYLTIGDQHMRELEALMLRISKPKGNKVKGRFARSASTSVSQNQRSPWRQSISRSLVRKDATIMRTRLCIQPVAQSSRIPASTMG